MLFCEIYRDYRRAKRGLSLIWPDINFRMKQHLTKLHCFYILRFQRPPMIFRSALVHSHPHPGVIDLRVEIHTSEINEYLFFFFDDQ